jgi:hypothetical protein
VLAGEEVEEAWVGQEDLVAGKEERDHRRVAWEVQREVEAERHGEV